jgi:hypothetical protein
MLGRAVQARAVPEKARRLATSKYKNEIGQDMNFSYSIRAQSFQKFYMDSRYQSPRFIHQPKFGPRTVTYSPIHTDIAAQARASLCAISSGHRLFQSKIF